MKKLFIILCMSFVLTGCFEEVEIFVDIDDLELVHIGNMDYADKFGPSPFEDFDDNGDYRLLHVESKEHVLFNNMPDDVVTRLQDDIKEYSYVAVLTLRQCPIINWFFENIEFPESGGSNLIFKQSIITLSCVDIQKAYIFRYSDVK